jgi:hypothetical protein
MTTSDSSPDLVSVVVPILHKKDSFLNLHEENNRCALSRASTTKLLPSSGALVFVLFSNYECQE